MPNDKKEAERRVYEAAEKNRSELEERTRRENLVKFEHPHQAGQILDIAEQLRKDSNLCVLIEFSQHPEEYICSLGWHHRGLWMEHYRTTSADLLFAIESLVRSVESQATQKLYGKGIGELLDDKRG